MYCASVSVLMTGFSHVVHQYFISSRQLVVQSLECMWVHLKSSIPFSSQGVQFTRKIMSVDPMRLKTFINCLYGQFSFASELIIFLVKKKTHAELPLQMWAEQTSMLLYTNTPSLYSFLLMRSYSIKSNLILISCEWQWSEPMQSYSCFYQFLTNNTLSCPKTVCIKDV